MHGVNVKEQNSFYTNHFQFYLHFYCKFPQKQNNHLHHNLKISLVDVYDDNNLKSHNAKTKSK